MISVLVYGRNDSYGYNLHKRAAISLNTFAALLDDPEDEIVFVDYNTPDDFPTFPEAIRDTLTQKTRDHLRVLRVRPELHGRRCGRSTLNVIEPIARNVGPRRTNPASRWVLNTNTDIILGMRGAEAFGAMVRSLESGFYQAPRVEIPEAVWEGFDRGRPEEVLDGIRELAPALHLDEIVYGNEGVFFDGPGDFQLAERSVLFALDGFHERMNQGWHVDSNLSVRMARHFGSIQSLEDRVFAYHCDHTRQVTPLHSPNSSQNDPAEFVEKLTCSDIIEQRETWGAPDEPVEEVRLDTDPSLVYLSSLKSAIGEPQTGVARSAYRHDSYDRTSYAPRHILPFLADLLSSAPRTLRVGWAGFQPETIARFLTAWREFGFVEPVRLLSDSKAGGANVRHCNLDEWVSDADLLVFDFGEPGSRRLSRMQRGVLAGALSKLRHVENARSGQGQALRRAVGINVVHNRYERVFAAMVSAAATPFSTRVRTGFARPIGERVDWLSLARSGTGDVTACAKGLKVGRHTLHLELAVSGTTTASITISAGDKELVRWSGDAGGIAGDRLKLPFDVASPTEEVRVTVALQPPAHNVVASLWSGPEGASSAAIDLPEMMVGNDRDWLPFTSVGTAGERTDAGVEARPVVRGHVVYGPYWSLPPGDYVATFALNIGETRWARALMSRRPLVQLDVRTSSGDRLNRRLLVPTSGVQRVEMPFTVADWHIGFPLEMRVFSGGGTSFKIERISVDRSAAADG